MRMGGKEEGSADGGSQWHAIFTRHQHEKVVASALAAKGCEVYLPLYLAVRKWQDRDKRLWLPLFPSYVFIREGMDRQFQIVTTPGVIRVVGWGGRAAIVPQSQLNAVRRIVESALPLEAHPYFASGDRVRVKGGPLAGLEGILARKKSFSRLVVSIDMLGRSAAVEVDCSNVERIAPVDVPAIARRFCAMHLV